MHRLKLDQLIGATLAFQHLPFTRASAAIGGFGFREIERWGIGPHLDLFHTTEERVAGVKRALAETGLSVWCFTPEQVILPVNIASGDAAYRPASFDRFRRAADIAASLGACYLFLTSGRGFQDEPAEVAWDRAAASLAKIAEYAASLGLRCLLEPPQRVETNVLFDAAGVRRTLDQAGAGTMDVVLDTVGMAEAGDTVADYLRLFGERLVHVQIVDGTPAGHLAWGDGDLPLGDYIEAMVEAGYAGKMTFEPFGDDSYALDPVATWRRCLDAVEPYLDRATVAA